MRFYQNRTVDEQASRLPIELRERYKATQLDRIQLFDGKELIEVHGYFEYSFTNEKSYEESPVRASDGSISNIDDYKTFLTPRLVIKYNMMGIEDYRALMKKLNSLEYNGIIVMCYDIVEDKRVKHEMYFAPPSMPVIYQQYLIALGVQDFTLEMIGTNTFSNISMWVDDKYEYTALKGYTWQEHCDEEGSAPFTISNNLVYHHSSVLTLNGESVLATDFIIQDGEYYT